MAYNKQTIDKIAAQALEEISHARLYKQGKVSNWQKNEEMYYTKKQSAQESRANTNLGRMQEFIHTILSKIDNPISFTFVKRKNSQLKRVEMLNQLAKNDAASNDWEIKDLVGKKQGILYGRAIYSYFADSINGYQAHLEPVDVYDFLIDPSCGGLDMEEANYMGAYSIVLNKKQLKEGVKNKIYFKSAVDSLVDGGGNADDTNQEEENKRKRIYDQNITITNKEESNKGKFRFWKWFTTYEGERFYLVLDNSGCCIRCDLLTDVFSETDKFPLGAWPFWSWACFPDLTEFWTPSYADYVREIFMAQDVSINQMLDNAEAINKPMRVVNINAFDDLSKLKYRRDGILPTKGDYDVSRSYQTIPTPSINTPIQVFNLLEAIQEKASGVTAGAKGVADEEGKVGIYEGNQQATADRFGLLNKSYSFGYKRFAELWEIGVRQHLIKKTAIDIIGPEGIEMHEVSRRDLFRKGDEYAVNIEASNAQVVQSLKERQQKLTFLSAQQGNQGLNQKKLFELQARIAGLEDQEIEQLLDTSTYGNSKVLSEADRDIEKLLDNEQIKPNKLANNAYKQRFVDYMRDHEEDMNQEQFMRMADYLVKLEEIIMRNEARNFEAQKLEMLKQGQIGATGQENPEMSGIPANKVPDITQQEVI